MGRRLQRLIGVVILTVLATLPVAATTCELLCERPSAASGDIADMSMHDGMSGCHDTPATSDTRIAGAAAHDCRAHDAGLGDTDASVIRTNRVEAGMAFVADTAAFTPVVFVAPASRIHPPASHRLDPAPPLRSLVLRV